MPAVRVVWMAGSAGAVGIPVSAAVLSTEQMEPGFAIIPMRLEHVADAARLHEAAFPEQRVARLGRQVTLALYRTYVESPRCIAFAAVDGARLIGVASGAMGPGFSKEVLRRHPWAVLTTALARLLEAPGSLRKLAGLLRPGTDPWPGEPARRFHWRMLLIDPEWRGQGVVVPLVRALLEEARQRGAREVCGGATDDRNLPMVWVQKVFGFEIGITGAGRRHYRLDLEKVRRDG
jgi:GNAT superfamily N-acetyltransferase